MLTIPQLVAFRNIYKSDKNKEFMIACEVLKIRIKKIKHYEKDCTTTIDFNTVDCPNRKQKGLGHNKYKR